MEAGKGYPIPATILVPLILASLFTAGCILISKLERYAEHITGVLGSVFVLVAVLATLFLIGRGAEGIARHVPRSAIKRVQTPQAPPQLAQVGMN